MDARSVMALITAAVTALTLLFMRYRRLGWRYELPFWLLGIGNGAAWLWLGATPIVAPDPELEAPAIRAPQGVTLPFHIEDWRQLRSGELGRLKRVCWASGGVLVGTGPFSMTCQASIPDYRDPGVGGPD